MSKHTPGPWIVDNGQIVRMDCDYICKVVIADVINPKNDELIAAAPDLAEALKYALNVIRTDGDIRQVEQIAAAALAKAGL